MYRNILLVLGIVTIWTQIEAGIILKSKDTDITPCHLANRKIMQVRKDILAKDQIYQRDWNKYISDFNGLESSQLAKDASMVPSIKRTPEQNDIVVRYNNERSALDNKRDSIQNAAEQRILQHPAYKAAVEESDQACKNQ